MKNFLAKLSRLFGLARPWDLFISHAHEDARCAADLAVAAKDEGLVPWLDKDDLRPGEQFPESITKAIKDSAVFVLLLSKTALKKPYVSHETSQAVAHSVPIVPVFLEQFETKDFQTPFDQATKFHGHTCRDGLTVEHCREIAKAVRRSRVRMRARGLAFIGAAAAIVLLTSILLFRPEQPRVSSVVLSLNKTTKVTLPVRSGDSFFTGDSIKFYVRADTPGYLYVFWIDPKGHLEPLFPSVPGTNQSVGRNPVKRNTELMYPPKLTSYVRLTPPEGREELFAMLSRKPLPEIEASLVAGKLLDSQDWIATSSTGGGSQPKAKGISEPVDEGPQAVGALGRFKLESMRGREGVAVSIQSINHVAVEKSLSTK